MNCEILFNFFENFRRLDPPWNSGKKLFFPKKAPKHVWTLGNYLDNLRTLKYFWFFSWICSMYLPQILSPENWPHIFKFRKPEKPCMEHLAQKLGKIASKHVQNTFGYFWKRLWSILEFWIFFYFFLKFFETRPSMEHGAIFFSKKMPQNMFKTSLDNFGNNSGIFCIYEFPLIFLRKLLMTPWNTGQKDFFKKSPQNTFAYLVTFLDNFRTLKFFDFLLEFFLSRYLKI